MTTWYEATVVKIEQATPTVRRFWLEIKGDEPFEFRAGQFVTFDLPIHERRQKRWRSYSIANAPDGRRVLEFCIVRLEEGAGTSYLFNEIKPGSSLRFKGPDGAFYLPKNIETDLVFICTGTGVAPFRSMIFDLKKSGQPHRNLHLIFGARRESDILYRDEFEALAAQSIDFQYDIALSRDENWSGNRGHVHQIYLEKYARPRPDVRFYLCGWSQMVDDAVANLLVKMGFSREQIVFELYG